jgi:hypothetical protein
MECHEKIKSFILIEKEKVGLPVFFSGKPTDFLIDDVEVVLDT